MLSKTFGSAVYGVEAVTITVEVSVYSGKYSYIVGLPDSAIKESLQRIETAIKSNGYYMPRIKIVINLAPADIRKSGTAFDLPIALGIMDASEQAFAEWRSENHGPPLQVHPGENHFAFPVEEIRLRPGTYLCNFIVSKPGLAQYLILAFRHQELTIRGDEGGACAYQL